MGVNGLWKLLEPSGKPVPVETLENKVLAVDVSIWLHQAMKGFQDAGGNSLPNAHLLSLFHRLCKLLFYKIKPVFVFDGGVPHLKKQTVAARRQQKSKAELNAERVREKLLKNILKHKAVKGILGDKAGPSEVNVPIICNEDDIFELPIPPPTQSELSATEECSSESEDSPHKHLAHDLHSLDVNSAHFKSLPADVRHDILTELKDTRKQNSWGRLHEMPEESGKFSSYQMNRLLKRRSVQVSLEEAEKEIGGKTISLGELEKMLNEHGVSTNTEMKLGRRIASDNTTRYIFINGSKAEEAESKLHSTEEADSSGTTTVNEVKVESKDEDSKIFEREIDFMFETLDVTKDYDELVPEIVNENDDKQINTISDKLQLARNFMFENSGLTQEQILAIIKNQGSPKKKKPTTSFTANPSTSKLNLDDDISIINQERAEMNSDIGNNTVTATDNVDNFVKTNPSMNVKNISAVEIIESKDNSDVDKKFENIDEVQNEVERSVLKPESDKQSGSDSDIEFVEVEDIPSSILLWEKKKVPILEVVIEPDKCNVEGDIFADIFSKSESNEKNLEIKSDQTLFTKQDIVDNKHVSTSYVRSAEKEVNTQVKQMQLPSTVYDTAPTRPEPFAYVKDSDEVTGELIVLSPELSVQDEKVKTIMLQTEELHHEPQTQNKMTDEQLQELQASLEKEHDLLLSEKSKQDRLAASITDQMYMEAQELLQLFGVPYIIAPMEAEAQCAFLEAVSLTNGTITDDSDIWLFGGQKVYKNFFNQKEYVMQFRAVDILHYFKLARQQMVLLALLVGSDYTPGLQGVGPVTALEILAAFPSACSEIEVESEPNAIIQSLKNFKSWWANGRVAGPRKASLRNKLKDLRLHEGFPSIAVVDAYLKPKIDHSKEKFSWSAPDLGSLRLYAREKFGWPKNKIDDILLPVMKKVGDRNSQQSLDSYFQAKPKLPVPEGTLSKRVQHAVQQIGGGCNEHESSLDGEAPPLKSRKLGPISQAKERQRNRGRGLRTKVSSKQESSATACNRESAPSTSGEFILQREKDKLNALKNKLKAIEVFRTSKTGLDRTKRQKRVKRRELLEANLSESSSSE